jgi:hypothetical protein
MNVSFAGASLIHNQTVNGTEASAQGVTGE